jgi:uncharacterized protein
MYQEYSLKAYDFLMIFLGLMIEATPFVVLGVLISSLVSRFVKSDKILKYKSKNNIISHIQSMFIGLALPVCECGNIPLAKRLSIVGFKPSEVITFMLAAPILNPLVWFSTVEAFNLDYSVAWIRIIAGACIAIIIGLIFSTHSNQKDLMLDIPTQIRNFEGFNKTINTLNNPTEAEHESFFVTFKNEFLAVFNMLLIGCFIAAAFQILVPRDIITAFGQDPILSVVALIGLAFVISICSSVDAFFALSLASTFSLGSIIAFLVFGPMIDIKTLSMLKSVYKVKTLVIMTFMVLSLSLLLGFGVNYFYKFNY